MGNKAIYRWMATLALTTMLLLNDTTVWASDGKSLATTNSSSAITYAEKNIPVNKFLVQYFSTEEPDKVVYQETVDTVAIQLVDEFHGIALEQFSARWAGDLAFAQDTDQVVMLSKSGGRALVTIDGNPLSFDGNARELNYHFTKGRHRVVVGYTNDDYTVGFRVSFHEPSKNLTITEAETMLKGSEYAGTKLLYGGYYESSAQDMSITLNLQPSDKPIVLFLNSYHPVEWRIKNPNKVLIKAVIFDSYSPGSSITGEGISGIPVFKMKDLVFAHFLGIGLSNHEAHIYQPNGEGYPKLTAQIQQLTGRKYDGLSQDYSANNVKMPETVMSEKDYEDLEKTYKQLTAMSKKGKVTLENMFSENGVSQEGTWGKYLNPKDKVPLNTFKAFYFDILNPMEVKKEEYRNNPSVHYSDSNFLNLYANRFCGYWVGDFEFTKDTFKGIKIETGSSDVRVFVDGSLVVSTSNGTIVPYTFRKGKHRIEVEYMNSSSVAAFSVVMADPYIVASKGDSMTQYDIVLSGHYSNNHLDEYYDIDIIGNHLSNGNSWCETDGAYCQVTGVTKTGVNSYDIKVTGSPHFSCATISGIFHVNVYGQAGKRVLDIQMDSVLASQLPFASDFTGIFNEKIQ